MFKKKNVVLKLVCFCGDINIEQYFAAVLYKVTLMFEPIDEFFEVGVGGESSEIDRCTFLGEIIHLKLLKRKTTDSFNTK